jgi:hypothetical protein
MNGLDPARHSEHLTNQLLNLGADHRPAIPRVIVIMSRHFFTGIYGLFASLIYETPK